MPKVKSNYAEKWNRITSGRSQDYEEGVKNPRTPWKEATLKAADNQAKGIQEAINDKRFEKGVSKAGNEVWLEGALTKGVTRFGQGVQLAEQKYQTNFAPYVAVIESITLPPRFPKGDPRNIDRVKAIAIALRNKKIKG